MRKLLMALVVVALAAAPGMASVSVRLVSDKAFVSPGDFATISIQMQGTTKSPGQLAGDIHASVPGGAKPVSGNFAWVPQFTAAVGVSNGYPLADGGWGGFGSGQAIPNDRTVGLAPDWWTVATFTVKPMSPAPVSLTFVPAAYSGFGPCKSVATPAIDSTIGTLAGVTINVPEPVSLALLAAGGLFAARRRR